MNKEEFSAILERQQESGLSIRDFCSNESYTVSSFHYWKSKFGFSRQYKFKNPEDQSPSGIIPVSLKSSHLSPLSKPGNQEVNSGEIAIKFPGGVEVTFTGRTQTEIALQVLNQICSVYVLPK